ncbi:MAG: cyclic nucleotide-binding domain-containing protein [Gammaproteobacteria bacterium]|nr:cyclic nucleotide-binding domain-containing protein [Gammaproteobacteria bacterium]
MLLHRLRRFAPFSEFSPADLATAAEHCRLLNLPARRWLVRPGRELSGSYFLDKGRVRLLSPDEVVEDGSERAREALYPGASSVATLTAVELLQVDTEALAERLAPANETAPPLYQSTLLREGWESRFLGTRIMQRLRPGNWQRILGGMRRVDLSRGERVITQGDQGEEFFVLCAGAAEVQIAGCRVAQLGPGDLFGEDALITGACRNATVTMTSDGSVMAVDEALFRSELLPLTTVDAATTRPLVRLSVGSAAQLRERIASLDRGCAYRPVGGCAGERALGAFILAQQGFEVSAVGQ